MNSTKTRMPQLILLEPQKIIELADNEYKDPKTVISQKAWKRIKKRTKNVIPYIESIPYDTDYIAAKVAVRSDNDLDLKDIKRYSAIFWKCVKDNMVEPRFKEVRYGNIGRHVLLMWRLKFFISIPLMMLAKTTRRAARAKNQDPTKSFTYKRLMTAFKIYRANRLPAKLYNRNVRKVNKPKKN